jgi:hypothetical protein
MTSRRSASSADDTVDNLTLTVSDVGGDVTPATALTDDDSTSVVPLGGGATTQFLELMADAEAVVLNPAATDAALQAVAKDLQRVQQAA